MTKKITLAKHSGFCFGVKRAVELAQKASANYNGKYNGKRIFVLGDLIHNPQVVADLEKKGIKKTQDIKNLKQGDILIIRSHGAPSEVYEYAKKSNISIIDTTCPFVKKAQEYAKQLYKEGYKVVIIGKEEHPEIKAIMSYAPNAIVIGKQNNIKEKLKNNKKLGVISQTTLSLKKFANILSKILAYGNEFKIFNTTCNATTQRQDFALSLAKESDIVIVIGGYKSSNTTKLKEICSEITETYHIEKVDELKKEWFKGKNNIGITSGTSTPDHVIKEVIEKIKSF